ncbi:PhzF family phenazine biosynthesis isomerase [Haloechinothrix sp. YIM 98757]|uniref:PhzF family phenazine biosynthesis isomerase n=1 Tax=Haloechinothrix aidingensis TaxID=2752311 RepID=A0A838A070_9PSEU|nr:PhzF family phenazine biosynthesis isomerase [Haloechinothrix aidingensis]MBA0124463.1 PhzF family phenazine biosynthesis isomerase [Haloechinothrix aidingensis]
MVAASRVDVLRYAAFTGEPAGGNPAGVVLDAGELSDAEMQRIAAEVGYSETAFVVDATPERGSYRLRYFSPRAEVAFCGHATVATAIAIAERSGTGEVRFEIGPGEMTLNVTGGQDGTLWATFTSVATRSRLATAAEWEPVLSALGWSGSELDPAYPPAVAYAGNDHLVLAAASRERLARLDYDFEALGAHMRTHGWTTVHLVWAQSATVFHARDPFPVGGVVEDPATGAAAAAFGGYVRELGSVGLPARLHIVQGEDMGRRSDLMVDLAADDDRVSVTGTAVRLPRPS